MKKSILHSLLLTSTLTQVLGSSLKGSKGLKAEKGLKGGHGIGEEGLRCHTEIDDVWEEKCATIYEDKCTVESRKQCRQVPDRQCSTQDEEVCQFDTTQKCSSIPIPKCGIAWEKVCSTQPSCQTHNEKQCTVVSKPECHTEYDRACSQVVETRCSTGHQEQGHLLKGVFEKGFHDKGAKKAQLLQGILEKKAILKGHLQSKLAKGGPVIGGHPGVEHEHVHPQAHPHENPHESKQVESHVYKRSFDEEKTKNGSKMTDEEKLFAKEAYAIHKKNLMDLKEQVEKELAVIEKALQMDLDSQDKDASKHSIEKRAGRSAVSDFNPKRRLRKRTLEVVKNQLEAELEILEEGDFTGDIEQIMEKRRRRSISDESISPSLNATEKAEETKRSFKGEKGIVTGEAGQKECWDEPVEKCISTPRQVCVDSHKEVCTDVPREVCTEVEHCKEIPKKDCHVIYKEICATLPTRKCQSVPREICIEVAKEVCEEVPHELCVPFPGKKCEKVIVKRPREVCLPPQKVRVLEPTAHPSYGNEEESGSEY